MDPQDQKLGEAKAEPGATEHRDPEPSEVAQEKTGPVESQVEELSGGAKGDPGPVSMNAQEEELTEAAKKGKAGAMDKLREDLTKKLEESKGMTEQAEELKKKAEELGESEEADQLRQQAADLEQKSKKLIRVAQRMQKGVYQGGAAGAGIGAGIAGGVGTLLGTVVGSILSVPTTGLGLLVGAGTGAVHGPWVKLVGDTVKEEDEAEKKEGEGGEESKGASEEA